MKTGTVSKLRVGGRDFAVVPWREYQRLTANGNAKRSPRKKLSGDDADMGDARRVAKAVERYRAGKLPTISHESLKLSLGL